MHLWGLLVEQTVHLSGDPNPLFVLNKFWFCIILLNFGVHMLEVVLAHAFPGDLEHHPHLKRSDWVRYWVARGGFTSTLVWQTNRNWSHLAYYSLFLFLLVWLLLLLVASFLISYLAMAKVLHLDMFKLHLQFGCLVKHILLLWLLFKRTTWGGIDL